MQLIPELTYSGGELCRSLLHAVESRQEARANHKCNVTSVQSNSSMSIAAVGDCNRALVRRGGASAVRPIVPSAFAAFGDNARQIERIATVYSLHSWDYDSRADGAVCSPAAGR